jgi:hypothetical protein
MGQHNLLPLNSPLVQSSDSNLANTFVERDASGNSSFNKAIAEGALESQGGLFADIDPKTTNYTATNTDFALAFTLAADATLTLPVAATSENQTLAVKLVSGTAFILTIDGNLSETIDGDAQIYLTMKYETVRLHCDGTSWHILSRHVPSISTTKAATYTVSGAANVYFNTEGSAYTINLPAAAKWVGKYLTFVKVDAAGFGAVLDGNASENINAATTYSMSTTQFRVTRIYSDGTQWYSA